MAKRALLIGVSRYESGLLEDLPGCVLDVAEMQRVLSRHANANQDKNFDCRILTSANGAPPVSRVTLRKKLQDTFDAYEDEILIYFSGHGLLDYSGGFIVAEDGVPGDPGIPMMEIHQMAHKSKAKTITIILDCCNAGSFGQSTGGDVSMRDGMTILGSSRGDQASQMTAGGGSVFTSLMVGGLEGGAANLRGHVTTASIYAYVDASLGEWGQRPIYKSYAKRVEPLRLCEPLCPDPIIREIVNVFAGPESTYTLTPKHEETEAGHDPEKVALFQTIKRLQIAGLVRPSDPNQHHLYWVALESGDVRLTELGKFYYHLVLKNEI